MSEAATLRLDKYLWFARLAKTRGVAQQVAEAGHIRIDGRVVDRAHAQVRVGNVLSFPLHGRVRVIRITALPARRSPAIEAQLSYEDLSPPQNREGGHAQHGGGGFEPGSDPPPPLRGPPPRSGED